MAKKLSDKDFLIAQLRTIAESGDSDGTSLAIRLGALDRLAAVLGAYAVVPKATAITVRRREEEEQRRLEAVRRVRRG